MLYACIYLWKADFFWGWQKQIGTALKPSLESKDSLPLQAGITKCQPFSFGAKIFVTSGAACLSRNIYSRTLSLKEQGLLCSKDLNCS